MHDWARSAYESGVWPGKRRVKQWARGVDMTGYRIMCWSGSGDDGGVGRMRSDGLAPEGDGRGRRERATAWMAWAGSGWL